jgi:phospholipid-binding lipoprotein MlaA
MDTKKLFLGQCLAVLVALLTGCASGPHANPQDPFEPWNRGVYQFNEGLDQALLKPVATAYQDTVPSPIRTGVGNFFGNIRDLWSAVNAALQLRPQIAVENFMRFNVNTFLGFAGVLDIATEMEIPRTTLDFGHTLGYWGMPSGPYLVLPVLGPSSVRDVTGLVVDQQGDLVQKGVGHVPTRNALQGLRIVNLRADLIPATNMLDQIALDKYSFVRDSYLQRRQSQIRPQKEDRYWEDDE